MRNCCECNQKDDDNEDIQGDDGCDEEDADMEDVASALPVLLWRHAKGRRERRSEGNEHGKTKSV